MRNSENVLNSLAGHSQDQNYKFERLYRLLFNENLFAEAYQRLSQNPGNCTKGTDGQTIDGTSIKRIRDLIEQLRMKAIVLVLQEEYTYPKRMENFVRWVSLLSRISSFKK